jgi:hypothetical protein
MSDVKCPYCGTEQEINHDDGYGYDEGKYYEQECVWPNLTEYRDEQGNFHREDDPAIEYGTGSMEYWVNGQRHREDGPALEYTDGKKEYYLHGKKYCAFVYHLVVFFKITLSSFRRIACITE